nr:MAG TPA: hypothetical protein [Caudoviricetes sp.]DAS39369.1 MAG TPA: hypothetical protein [Caudoviricetes sp.]
MSAISRWVRNLQRLLVLLGRHHSRLLMKSTEKNSFSAFLWHTQNIGCCIANSFNTFF